jgi:hypothetical protein
MLHDGVSILKSFQTARNIFVAAFIVFLSLPTFAQSFLENPSQPESASDDDRYLRDMDDLMHARLQRERVKWGSKSLNPEILRLEANYIRTDAPTGEVVLHEASFHLEPRYFSYSPEGRETNSPGTPQAIMYFVGSARTPLALPLVSNLSKVLSGDEASYTVYLGILPLPNPVGVQTDSVHYYCIIERAIESNRSDAKVSFERYAKEFSVKQGEPVQMRLENTPPDRQAYIVKIEDNIETLNFYEDFARHFNEHILLSGERMQFGLGKADLSAISSRLSIPYTIGKTSHVKVELLSIVDEAHPLVLVDSIMRPADYLAAYDMKSNVNGTYRYRITARESESGNVLFSEVKSFEKKQPLIVGPGIDLASADTLEVGGKKVSAQKKLQDLNQALMTEKVKSERLDASLQQVSAEKEKLKEIVNASQSNVIAGLRARYGIGLGKSTGINLFIGAESAVPSLTLDVSYGLLYSSAVPYLAYEEPKNFSQIFTSPKSLGLQIGWAPMSLLDGLLSPVVRLGYFGIYSTETDATKGGRHSATLLVPTVGISSTPGGKGTSLGFDFAIGPAFGLGIAAPAQFDIQLKFYLRY